MTDRDPEWCHGLLVEKAFQSMGFAHGEESLECF